MADARFTIAHLDDVPVVEASDVNEPHWKPVRNHLGVEAFGVNAFVATAAGDVLIEEHDEAGDSGAPHQELYYVAHGRANFILDGEQFEAPAGTFVFVADPAVRRFARAHAAGDTVLAFGAPAGAPFTVSPWERRELRKAAL